LADTILVVDDEPRIRELTQMILEDKGYRVITAENGVEALQKAERETPDLVLLDVVLPGISGVEVCRILKSQAKTRSIPLVMFTVLGRDVDQRLAEESGCDGYFLKPFTPEDLFSEVKKYLKKTK
jgi:two-component system alkaline phosphatase synthesis response regulator PhoP